MRIIDIQAKMLDRDYIDYIESHADDDRSGEEEYDYDE